MRTPLLCALALLGCACAASAQGWLPQQGPYPGRPAANGYNPAMMGWPTPQQQAAPTGGYPGGPQDFYYTAGQYQQAQFMPPPYQPPMTTGTLPFDPSVDPTCSPLADHVAAKEKETYWWVSSDYSFTWLRSQVQKIPLVTTTNNPADLPPGAIGQPGTQVLYDSGRGSERHIGVHGELGVFLDCERTLSLETVAWWVLPNHERFSSASDAAGNPAILRPAFDVVSGGEIGVIDALPGIAAGRVDVDYRSEIFGLEINGRCHHCFIEKQWYADALFGFRYLSLMENLTIRDQTTPLVDNTLAFQGVRLPAGATISDVDDFSTTNRFWGAQVGGRMRFEGPLWLLHFTGKVALGATDMEGHINGTSRLTTAASSQVASGGVLALPNNIGRQNQTVLGFVPDCGMIVGLRVLPCVQIQAGYNFLFWSQVVRPAGLIDRNINTTTLPSALGFGANNPAPLRPTPLFAGESFWVHSVSLRLVAQF